MSQLWAKKNIIHWRLLEQLKQVPPPPCEVSLSNKLNLMLCFRFLMFLPHGHFYRFHDKPSGWTHVMMIYTGTGNGEGIIVYYNGVEVARTTANGGGSYSTGDGRVAVGRYHTDKDERYATVAVDELIFFNRALTSDETATMYNWS